MNILILSWRGPKHPNAGGAEISTHEHAKGWVKAGHNVTLFTAAFVGGKDLEIIDGVNIIRQGRQIFGVQWEAFKWYLFSQHPKFNLIVDQFHGIPFFSPVYVRCNKIAFIHEVTKEVWRLNPLPKPFNFIPALLGPLLEPFIFIFYKNIQFMTVSESTKVDLIRWGIKNKNIQVVHNGITVPKKVNANKEKIPTLIFLGALSRDKGIETAIKVFSILNKNKILQYWVIGGSSTQYLKYLKLQAQELGLGKRIRFLGFVSEKKKFELLKRAHILVNPSIREGWGLVVIEAAAMGTPAVAFNSSGLKDSIIDQETGLLSKESTAKSMADSINSLLTNQPLLDNLSRKAIKRSHKFNWEKASKESLDLIYRVIHFSNS